MYLLSSVSQFLCDILPSDSFFSHEHHAVIEEIGDLVLDLLGIRILRRDDDLGTLLAHFFQDLIDTFLKEVVGVGALLRMKLPVLDDAVDLLQNL